MHQPGVELRPLREMTGHAMFNEVFLDEARVPDAAIIGDLNNGWAVGQHHARQRARRPRRRRRRGGGGHGHARHRSPASSAGRVGDFARRREGAGEAEAAEAKHEKQASVGRSAPDRLRQGQRHQPTDPTIRQDLVRLHILGELGRFNGERLKATRAAGGDIPGMANISKLSMSDIVRLQRDLGLRIAGRLRACSTPTPPEQRQALDAATGNPFLAMVTGTALYAQAPPIYGGTDQIQRNIIGERALGLPKEPGRPSTPSRVPVLGALAARDDWAEPDRIRRSTDGPQGRGHRRGDQGRRCSRAAATVFARDGYEGARLVLEPNSPPVLDDLPPLLDDLRALYEDLHAHRSCPSRAPDRRCPRRSARRPGLGGDTGVGRTGVVATLRSGDGPRVLLRADIDALPVEEDTGLAYASTATGIDRTAATCRRGPRLRARHARHVDGRRRDPARLPPRRAGRASW